MWPCLGNIPVAEHCPICKRNILELVSNRTLCFEPRILCACTVTVLTVSTRLSLMLTAVLIFLSLSVYTGLRALDPTAESGRHRAHGHPHTAPGGGRPGPLFHGLSTGRRVEIQADSQTHAALYRTNHITHPLGAKTAHQNRTNYNSHPEQ